MIKCGFLRIQQFELETLEKLITGKKRIVNTNFKLHNIRKVDNEIDSLEMAHWILAIECDGLPQHEPGYVRHCHLEEIKDTDCLKVVAD